MPPLAGVKNRPRESENRGLHECREIAQRRLLLPHSRSKSLLRALMRLVVQQSVLLAPAVGLISEPR
jgi:hypothetical protein